MRGRKVPPPSHLLGISPTYQPVADSLTPRARLEAALKAQRNARTTPRAKWTRDRRGRNHPSASEAEWFDRLYDREERGEIAELEIEPSFRIELTDPDGGKHWLCNVKADARYRVVATGAVRVVDHKGRLGDTEVSRLKRRAVKIQHRTEIELEGKYVEQQAREKAKRKAARRKTRVERTK